MMRQVNPCGFVFSHRNELSEFRSGLHSKVYRIFDYNTIDITIILLYNMGAVIRSTRAMEDIALYDETVFLGLFFF